jgi:hypothetical protein
LGSFKNHNSKYISRKEITFQAHFNIHISNKDIKFQAQTLKPKNLIFLQFGYKHEKPKTQNLNLKEINLKPKNGSGYKHKLRGEFLPERERERCEEEEVVRQPNPRR